MSIRLNAETEGLSRWEAEKPRLLLKVITVIWLLSFIILSAQQPGGLVSPQNIAFLLRLPFWVVVVGRDHIYRLYHLISSLSTSAFMKINNAINMNDILMRSESLKYIQQRLQVMLVPSSVVLHALARYRSQPLKQLVLVLLYIIAIVLLRFQQLLDTLLQLCKV
jgi:hypothetical protein